MKKVNHLLACYTGVVTLLFFLDTGTFLHFSGYWYPSAYLVIYTVLFGLIPLYTVLYRPISRKIRESKKGAKWGMDEFARDPLFARCFLSMSIVLALVSLIAFFTMDVYARVSPSGITEYLYRMQDEYWQMGLIILFGTALPNFLIYVLCKIWAYFRPEKEPE